ncbi:MAG: phage tail protein [Cohaesibacter sp.]|jgi:hypothetical protein|nr:phage tail protein [Cohaesibacter sp.]
MTIFAYLGDFQLGQSGVMTGPISDSQTWDNHVHEHKVLRGKPVIQTGGEELDKRTISFFFDESFCDPQGEFTRLKAARSAGSVMPFISGFGGYDGKQYFIRSISSEVQKTTEGGRIVRLETSIELVEVAGASLSIGGLGGAVASAARAIINPLIRRS